MAGSPAPGWLRAGTGVRHSTFGTGVVHSLGDYKGVPTVWVDFDYGARKGMALEFALPRLASDTRASRTPADPSIRCDTCGGRPVTLTAGDQQYCEAHVRDHDPTRA